jgi:DNA-binding response OmpR family regulator
LLAAALADLAVSLPMNDRDSLKAAAEPRSRGGRLLLVEDDATIAAAAYRMLTGEAHVVDIASTASAARAAVDRGDYDLVILDLSLPDGDGVDLLQQWRGLGRTVPVIVVTARAGIEDKVAGLDSGADDYLTKPFEMRELLARVRATLRRRGPAGDQQLSFANLELDTVRRQLRVAGRRINAPRRELAMLELLLRRAGEVADRDEVMRAAYAEDEHTSSNVLEANVSRLRQRLAAAGGNVQIESIRGVGYLLREVP